MRFSTKNIQAFNSFFETVSKVADEITMMAYEEYLRCQVIAKSAILIFDVCFEKDFFEYYDGDAGECMTLVASDMSKILKSIKKDDDVIFDSNDYELLITVEGDYRRSFRISLINEYDTFRDMPSLDLTVGGGGELKKFQQCLKDMDLMESPTVNFSTENEELIWSGKNTYKGDFSGRVCNVTGDAKAEYNKEKMDLLFSFKNMGEWVSLKYDKGMPLVVEYNPTSIKLVGMLAPILGEDE